MQHLQDEGTKKRELDGLLEAIETYGLHIGTILTEVEELELVGEGRKITVLPVWKWKL